MLVHDMQMYKTALPGRVAASTVTVQCLCRNIKCKTTVYLIQGTQALIASTYVHLWTTIIFVCDFVSQPLLMLLNTDYITLSSFGTPTHDMDCKERMANALTLGS